MHARGGRLSLFIAVVLSIRCVPACAGAPHAPKAPVARKATHPPRALEVQLVIDREYDAKLLFDMLQGTDPAGAASRARDMGLAPEVAKEIQNAPSFAAALGTIGPIVDERYRRLGDVLREAKSELQVDWARLGARFSVVVVERTGSPWLHDDYVATVSAFHKGISDWHGNHVAVGARLDRGWRTRILAHEIALSELFQLLRRRYDAARVPDSAAWAFAEITAVFVLDDPRLRGFWPEDLRPAGSYFSGSNYPQLGGVEPRLKVAYDRSETFDAYLQSAVAILVAAGAARGAR